MIQRSDLFHLPYYEKARFTGSLKGMRYCVEKFTETEDSEAVFRVWVFPGPLCFENTEEQKKRSTTFPYAEESLSQIADWLNQQYESNAGEWARHMSLFS